MKKIFALALLAATLIVPQTASALENEDLLALVAMPLAVAAVSEVTDVPMNEVLNVVSLLNDAAVPPSQFIEMVRYVPVVLAEDNETNFVEFVRLREQEGLRGTSLVTAIEDHLRADIPAIDLTIARPRVDIAEDFVFERDERRSHPHGGPPGQLKKSAGVQTGAEIVHGSARGRDRAHAARVARRERKLDDDDQGRVATSGRIESPRVEKRRDHDRGRGRGSDDDNRGGGNGGGNGNGKGKGKG
jgi:hypothetical protein